MKQYLIWCTILMGCIVVTSCDSQQKKKEEAARIEALAQEKADSIARVKEQEEQEMIKKEQERVRREEERVRREEEEERVRREEEEERVRREQEERGPKEKGWRFICQRLKSPSTAVLAGYVGPEVEACQVLARKINMRGLSLAMFSVDAQNGFGATVREEYIVFFKNGEPKHIERSESVANGSLSMLKMALEMNGFNN